MIQLSWTQRWRMVAVVGLCAFSPAVWGQELPSLEAPLPAGGQNDVIVWAAAAPAAPLALQKFFAFAGPQEFRWQVAQAGPASDEGAFFFTQEAAQPNAVRVRIVKEKEEAAGDHWIGVQLEPLPEIITSQLKLERGMVVVHVFPDSPAAKAEFKVNDIVLRAGDKDVKEPQDLIAAVNDAKDKELVVIALRGGTETILKVTPAQRPKENLELAISPETPHAAVVEALEELHKKAPDGDVRLFAVRPGGVYAYARQAKFPTNLEIAIEKRGDKPTTIRVKRIQEGEDKTWEVTEDKIGELPEDIRAHVQQLLGGHAQAGSQMLLPRVETYRARAVEQFAKAQEQAAEAHKRADEAQKQLSRTLREYRIQVRPPQPVPGTPAVPATPAVPGAPAAALVPYSIQLPHLAVSPQPDAIQAKLDAILKKLDQQQSESLQRLQKEVQQLRKELDDLRQGKK